MPRPARPDDLYRLAVPIDPRLSPDGRGSRSRSSASASARDGYRTAVWLAPADGSARPASVTLGAGRTGTPGSRRTARRSRSSATAGSPSRRSPTGRRSARSARTSTQVHLLPLDGGEARRLTDLPRGVTEFWWSPDGTTLAVLTSSLGATARGGPPPPRPAAQAQARRAAAVRLPLHRPARLPVQRRRVRRRPGQPHLAGRRRRRARPGSWSPAPRRGVRASPGRPTARGSRSRPTAGATPTSTARSGMFVVDVATGEVRTIARRQRRRCSSSPPGRRDGTAIVALGERFPRGGYRTGIWRFAADGSDAGAERRHRPARGLASSSRTRR